GFFEESYAVALGSDRWLYHVFCERAREPSPILGRGREARRIAVMGFPPPASRDIPPMLRSRARKGGREWRTAEYGPSRRTRRGAGRVVFVCASRSRSRRSRSPA